MKEPDHPNNEESRLTSLRSLDILDTAEEERFDRLTRLAKRMFNVPIALVSLVDENRQWFKSCVGLDVRETPRNISFCGHAILGDEIFIINDASKDDRFADNPLVVEGPYIRFYAGCPLRHHDGSKMGTLCVIDSKPRSFDHDDQMALKDLAGLVEREMAAIQMATIDDLTLISNRRGFIVLAEKFLNICRRQEIPATLIFLDLNGFKPINDQFGHAEGDKVLVSFAEHIRETLRDSDIFARLGGDEFVMLLTNTTKEIAEKMISRLRDSINGFNQKENRGYNIAFSVGMVSIQKKESRTIEELLHRADSRMYEEKNLLSAYESSIAQVDPEDSLQVLEEARV